MKKKLISNNAFTTGNRIQLIRGGHAFFEKLLHCIAEAQHTIHLQTYIFSDDVTGRLVASALEGAARRGLRVYLLVDGYASQRLPDSMIESLRESGVNFRFFQPFFRSRNFYFGRRLHHKVFVADNKLSLVGGINIADRYNDMPDEPAWLDFALFCEGPIAQELCVLCWKTWKNFPDTFVNAPCNQLLPEPPDVNSDLVPVRMRRNDWVRHKNEISGTYIHLLRSAQNQVTILCSYFLPGKIIRRLLRNAARRGVKIRIITAGPSDIMVAKHAERWMYDWLLRNKMEIYEYQPTVLHAKVAVCDDQLVTIGSYNVNNISAYASIELNLDVMSPQFAGELNQQLSQIISDQCIQVTPESHQYANHIFARFWRWLAYETIRVIFYMITFYYKQRKVPGKSG